MSHQDFETTVVAPTPVGMVTTLTQILVIVGALNWGLIGAFDFNLVTFLFGSMPAVVTAIYVIVGLCAVYQLLGTIKLLSRPRI